MFEQNKQKNNFSLRRRFGPILGFPIFLCIPLIALTFGSLKTNNFDWIKIVIPTFILLYGFMLFFQLGYRLIFKDNKIIQRASNGEITTIEINEIENIKQETSDTQTLISLRRPSNRITIYAKEKIVDVSLKHFKSEDVRKLMKIIHDHRPEITIPNGWI